MKLDPIIRSLLDTDLYKFNMNQVVFHKRTNLYGTYLFKCRNTGVKFTNEMVKEIKEQVDYLCTLSFTKDELNYLRKIRFIKPDYVEFLRMWRPMRDYVTVCLYPEGELHVEVNGPIFACMPFEIYLLEIINEVYFAMQYDYQELEISARKRLREEINNFKLGKYTFRFAEFGCRRRLSRRWQEEVVRTLKEEVPNMVGTSNVYLAKKYGLLPVGTYAHEFVEMYQGIDKYPLAYGNYYAMKDWYEEYRGDNGIALSDTLTTDLFLMDFDRSMANNFSGVRHDSGDPYEWGEKIIAHYKQFGIDPKTKTLLFSDSLNFEKAQQLYDYFKDRINVSFGIGTYCTNNTDVDALNIVIKLQYVNGRPVAKISDAPGKTMCPSQLYEDHLKEEIEFRIERGKRYEV